MTIIFFNFFFNLSPGVFFLFLIYMYQTFFQGGRQLTNRGCILHKEKRWLENLFRIRDLALAITSFLLSYFSFSFVLFLLFSIFSWVDRTRPAPPGGPQPRRQTVLSDWTHNEVYVHYNL